MYWIGIPPVRHKRMTEEEFLQQQDMKGLGLRLAISFALFAGMVVALNLAYENKSDRLQTMSADREYLQSEAR